jgi:hypothetical protein
MSPSPPLTGMKRSGRNSSAAGHTPSSRCWQKMAVWIVSPRGTTTPGSSSKPSGLLTSLWVMMAAGYLWERGSRGRLSVSKGQG